MQESRQQTHSSNRQIKNLVAAIAVFCASYMPVMAQATLITINPTSDGSLYAWSEGNGTVSEGGYLLASGYIQGVVKFSTSSIPKNVEQAYLTVNAYGLPLWSPKISVYGYGTSDGQLAPSDAYAGIYLGTLTLNPAWGQDAFFDVSSFVASTSAPFLAFNLRTVLWGADVLSSLEYNHGHPSQLTVAVPEPASIALMGLGLMGIGVSRLRTKKSEQ